MAAAAHLRWRAIDCVLWHQGSLVAPGAALGLSRAAGAVPVALALLTGRPCLSSSISSASAAWCPSQRLQHRAARRRLARRRPWPPLRAVADEEQLASASPAAVQQHDHDSDALLEARAPEDGGLPSALPAPGAWAGMVAAWPQQQLEPALYIVPTPIGNLADITLRALTVLRSVNLVLAEDTRHSRQLLTHFGIRAELMSCHAHNERLRVPGVLRRLEQGEPVALVSDAGTPGISDPGHDVICAAIQAGVKVVPLPGPCAFVAALVASGLPTTAFTFVGFLPPKKGARRTRLLALRSSQSTLVFYSSPHAVLSVLTDMAEVFGARRRVCVARELTKRYEELLRGDLEEAVRAFTEREPRGEFCLVVEGAPAAGAAGAELQLSPPGDAVALLGASGAEPSGSEPPPTVEQQALAMLQELVGKQGLSRSDAAKVVAGRLGIKRKQLYALAAAAVLDPAA